MRKAAYNIGRAAGLPVKWVMDHPKTYAAILVVNIVVSFVAERLKENVPAWSYFTVRGITIVVSAFALWVAIMMMAVSLSKWYLLRRRNRVARKELADLDGKTVHVYVDSRPEYRCADCQTPTDDHSTYELRLQKTVIGTGASRDDVYELVCPDCYAKSLMAMGFTPAEVVRMPDPRLKRRE